MASKQTIRSTTVIILSMIGLTSLSAPLTAEVAKICTVRAIAGLAISEGDLWHPIDAQVSDEFVERFLIIDQFSDLSSDATQFSLQIEDLGLQRLEQAVDLDTESDLDRPNLPEAVKEEQKKASQLICRLHSDLATFADLLGGEPEMFKLIEEMGAEGSEIAGAKQELEDDRERGIYICQGQSLYFLPNIVIIDRAFDHFYKLKMNTSENIPVLLLAGNCVGL